MKYIPGIFGRVSLAIFDRRSSILHARHVCYGVCIDGDFFHS